MRRRIARRTYPTAVVQRRLIVTSVSTRGSIQRPVAHCVRLGNDRLVHHQRVAWLAKTDPCRRRESKRGVVWSGEVARAFSGRSQFGALEVFLTTVPDRLRNGENVTDASLVQTKLELEHHLIEGPFKDGSDVGSFDALAQPTLVVSESLAELTAMHAQALGQIPHGGSIRSMEVHGLNFEYSDAADAGSAVGTNDFDDSNVGGEFQRAVGLRD